VDPDAEWADRRSLGEPGWRARRRYLHTLAPRLGGLLAGRRATRFAAGGFGSL